MLSMPVIQGKRKGEILQMSCSPETSLEDIRCFLHEKLGNEKMWVFVDQYHPFHLRRNMQGPSKSLRNLKLPCSMPVKPIPGNQGNDIYINVKTLTCREIFLGPLYPNTDTIGDVKHLICEAEGIPEDQQRFVFDSKALEEVKTLGQYGIQDGSTLHLILRLRGGGPVNGLQLTDVSKDEARRDVEWSSTAPDWRVARKGFAMEGTCKNDKCRAYNHSVIGNFSFGMFDIKKIELCCPMCWTKIEKENLGFNNCFYKMRGIKADSQDVFSTPWTKVGDVYRTWDKDEAGSVEWEDMMVYVKELTWGIFMPGSKGLEVPVAEHCAICFERMRNWENMTDWTDVLMLKCHHSYHFSCWKEWEDASLSRNNDITCPLCRAVIECH